MGKVTGLPVVRIVRVRIGELRLGNLKPKGWRYLSPQEVTALKKPAGQHKTKPETIKPTAIEKQKSKNPLRKPRISRSDRD